jgi:hypothetical protein
MAQRFYEPIARIFTNAGAVGVGYKYYFYQTGTTTAVTTYQNDSLTVANTNPVISDSNGRFPEIWYLDLSQLKLIVKDSSDNTLETVDPVGASASAVSLNDFDVRPTSYWGLTGGTSTAYTLVANPTISAYNNTQTFLVQFNVSCGNNPTLAIDGLSALNLKKYNATGAKVSLIEGDIQASTRYLATNDGVDIVISNPEYPDRFYANTTTKRGFTYLPSQITISYNSATAISFSDGVFQFSDGSGQAAATAMTKTLQSSGSWAAGTGQNGLDTGAKANSIWYYCYAIYNPTTLASDFLFSASPTSPTLPSGFTKSVRIKGFFKTNSSGNIIPFYLSSRGNWSINTTTAADQLLATASSTGGTTVSNAFPAVANKATVTMEIVLTQNGYSSLTVWGNLQSTPSAATPSTAGLRGSSIGTNNSYSCAGIGELFNNNGTLSYRNIESSGGVSTNRICYLSIEDLT